MAGAPERAYLCGPARREVGCPRRAGPLITALDGTWQIALIDKDGQLSRDLLRLSRATVKKEVA